MKKKVIGFVILFVVLLLGLSTICYADTISSIRSDLHKIYDAGLFGTTDFSSTINLNGYNSYSNYVICIGQGSVTTTTQPTKMPTTRYLYILANNGNTIGNQDNNNTHTLYNLWNNVNLCTWYNISTGAKVSAGNFYGNDLAEPYYIYTTVKINTRSVQLEAGEEYGDYIFTTAPSTFEYVPRSTQPITVNGVTFDCYQFGANINSVNIGTMYHMKDYELINVFLYAYVNEDVLDNVAQATYRYPNLTFSGGVIINAPRGEDSWSYVNIDVSKILYNQAYELTFALRKIGSSEIVYDEGNYHVYFKPLGDSSSSGDLVNPELNTGIDLEFMNNFDKLLQQMPSGNMEYLGDAFFGFPNWSGDSGDINLVLGGLNLDKFRDIGETDTTIFSIYSNIITSLSGSGNESISFTINGHSYTINSSDFTVPNGPLKSLVTMLCVCGLLLLFYQQIHGIIINIRTLNVQGAIHSLDVDHSIFM